MSFVFRLMDAFASQHKSFRRLVQAPEIRETFDEMDKYFEFKRMKAFLDPAPPFWPDWASRLICRRCSKALSSGTSLLNGTKTERPWSFPIKILILRWTGARTREARRPNTTSSLNQ